MFDTSIGTTRRARRGMLREWRLHALSMFSLSVAFVCLGASLLVLTNLRAIEQRWAHAGRASVYLKDGASAEQIDSLKRALARVPWVTDVKHITSSQARLDLDQNDPTTASELASLPNEVFPASLEVQVRADVTDAELNDMTSKLRLLGAVEGVETYQAWTERLSRLVQGGVAAAAILALVVFVSVLAVVGSTVRLAMQRRRTEVEVLKLVGATERYIKGPFLVEGMSQGGIGAACAIVLLAAMFAALRARLDAQIIGLLGVEPSFLPWQAMVAMVLVGMALGTTAAFVGLRKLVTV